MNGHEVAMLMLISLPFAVIGFVGGMVWMRWQYLEQIRRQNHQIARLERRLYTK